MIIMLLIGDFLCKKREMEYIPVSTQIDEFEIVNESIVDEPVDIENNLIES
jgi:hypothetical protein